MQIGLLKINLKEILKFYKQDIIDDWFQDPLKYNDILSNHDRIQEYFDKNLEYNNGEFKPLNRIILNIPKKGSTLRYSLETCIYDRLAYHSFGLKLIEQLDKILPRRVFSHRYDNTKRNASNRRYLFLNAIEQWKKFEEFVRIDSHNKTILFTDLLNYYENININKLESNLLYALSKIDVSGRDKAALRFCIQSLNNCLKYWSFNGQNGLPQNRDISSFLANIYLLKIDEYIIEKGCDYYRYMDDIRIICNNREQARWYLKQLIVKLREYGLNVNGAKTHIVEPNSDDHKKYLKRDDFELEKIDSMLKTRKRAIVFSAYETVTQKLDELISNKELNSRPFRFYLKRLSKLALCKEIRKPRDYFKSTTTGLLSNLGETPDVSDQFYLYLSAVELTDNEIKNIEGFLLNQEGSIYGWQNYFLWKLLILKEYSSQRLIELALSFFDNIEGTSESNLAGSFLYVGKFGTKDHIRIIAENFKNLNDFFLQRHALIALQTQPYDLIKDTCEKYIHQESRGIYSSLKRHKNPQFVLPPDPIKYTDILGEVSNYG